MATDQQREAARENLAKALQEQSARRRDAEGAESAGPRSPEGDRRSDQHSSPPDERA